MGVEKHVPYAYQDSGWGWHGCGRHGFTCDCDSPGPTTKAWSADSDARKFEAFFLMSILQFVT